MNLINGKRILITGGTGSLGKALVQRLLSGQEGKPANVAVFSRDELKQSQLRAQFYDKRLQFIIGDVRDHLAIGLALRNVEIVFNTAALKRVEACERQPIEAAKTNIIGTINIVEAIQLYNLPVRVVVGVSSDKSRDPANVYGSTKHVQERILIAANEDCRETRFVSVCYGNVMGSRGSVIPIFQELIKARKPITIHDPDMTRFLISLDQAVDALLACLNAAKRGEIYVPMLPAARVKDIAEVLIDGRDIKQIYTGKGLGEKMHETLITEAEVNRVIIRGGYYVVKPDIQAQPAITEEYKSKNCLIDKKQLRQLFDELGLLV